MATHGKTREDTINQLSTRTPFKRSGFAMKGVAGAYEHTGQLHDQAYDQYVSDKNDGIHYTVVSYTTPIAWVKNDGTVVIPDAYYSPTTSNHQGLCRAYLR